MTVTVFKDVDDKDLKKSNSLEIEVKKLAQAEPQNEALLGMQVSQSLAQTVEYIEYNGHSGERRRRLFRILTWLLIAFLLVDFGIVVYIVARARLGNNGPSGRSTYTCRLVVNRRQQLEQISRFDQQVLIRPLWPQQPLVSVLHDFNTESTIISLPHLGRCYVKPMHPSLRLMRSMISDETIGAWAAQQHEVTTADERRQEFLIDQLVTQKQLLQRFGLRAVNICKALIIYKLSQQQQQQQQQHACPMVKCVPCPSGVYLRDEFGCRTCECGTAGLKPLFRGSYGHSGYALDRSRRSSGSDGTKPKVLDLVIYEGVMPAANQGQLSFIDVIYK